MNNVKLPIIIDGATNKPSITLTFAYISFVLVVAMIVSMAFSNLSTSVYTALFLFFGCATLYKMRQIDKVKFSKSGFSMEDKWWASLSFMG